MEKNDSVTSNEASFEQEKIGEIMKFSKDFITDKELKIGSDNNDFMTNTLTAKMIAKIYTNTIDERDLIYYAERPTFFDWLFRRKKKVVFRFKAKDLLFNPPKNGNSRIYIIERDND